MARFNFLKIRVWLRVRVRDMVSVMDRIMVDQQ